MYTKAFACASALTTSGHSCAHEVNIRLFFRCVYYNILYTTTFRRAPVRQPIGSRGNKKKTNVPMYYYHIIIICR